MANVEDVNGLFRQVILPICIGYGKEYVSAAITVQKAYQEAINVLPDKNIPALMAYLKSSDLLSQETDKEASIVLTTVHKAKGKEFDNVIYIPSKTTNRSNFQDSIVTAILKSKGISAEEELEEETLRINFVAFTRAEKNLIILTDKVQDYLNDSAELGQTKESESKEKSLEEAKKQAYTLFVNKRFDEAKKLLDDATQWIKDYVKNHFDSLKHVSFSSIPDKPYEYFTKQILGIKEFTAATTLGNDVHHAAQALIEEKEPSINEEAKPYVDNVNTILQEIKKTYPEVGQAEKRLHVPLKALGFDSDLHFTGYIDAIFKNNDTYLIVDWKTTKNTNYGASYRQQLEAYKKAFAAKENIPEEKVSTAIAYVGLRPTINLGTIGHQLDLKQPSKTAFDTVSKRINRLLGWIKDPDCFFQDFIDEGTDDMLWRSVVEEYRKNG